MQITAHVLLFEACAFTQIALKPVGLFEPVRSFEPVLSFEVLRYFNPPSRKENPKDIFDQPDLN